MTEEKEAIGKPCFSGLNWREPSDKFPEGPEEGDAYFDTHLEETLVFVSGAWTPMASPEPEPTEKSPFFVDGEIVPESLEIYVNGIKQTLVTPPEAVLDVDGSFATGIIYPGVGTAPSDGLLLGADGKVGIGTKCPTVPLQIVRPDGRSIQIGPLPPGEDFRVDPDGSVTLRDDPGFLKRINELLDEIQAEEARDAEDLRALQNERRKRTDW